MKMTYDWQSFRMTFDTETGECITHYPGGKWSGCGVVDGDHHHAAILGITPQLHRLEHELAHHLIGTYFYGKDTGSPVVYRDAHHIPQEEGGWVKEGWSEADREEWLCKAIQYLSHDKPTDEGTMEMMEREGVDPHLLAYYLKELTALAVAAGRGHTTKQPEQ